MSDMLAPQPLLDVLQRVTVHDAEIVDLQCELGFNTDATLTLRLDPYWERGTNQAEWTRLTIWLGQVWSVELAGHEAFKDIRRNVAGMLLHSNALYIRDTLGGKTTIQFRGKALARLSR